MRRSQFGRTSICAATRRAQRGVIDAGRTRHDSNKTTDIAFSISTPNGVVTWVCEANAIDGYTSRAVHNLPGLGIDIAPLLTSTVSARQAAHLISEIAVAAQPIATCDDPHAIADAYELADLAARQLNLTEPIRANRLIGIAAPETVGWNDVRKYLQGPNQLTPLRAIEAAGLISISRATYNTIAS